jgi:hypothetical protein
MQVCLLYCQPGNNLLYEDINTSLMTRYVLQGIHILLVHGLDAMDLDPLSTLATFVAAVRTYSDGLALNVAVAG